MLYLRYGCYTKGMDVIPKVCMLYLRYMGVTFIYL